MWCSPHHHVFRRAWEQMGASIASLPCFRPAPALALTAVTALAFCLRDSYSPENRLGSLLKPRRKKRRDSLGVARPWEPGYKKPQPKPYRRILPSTPFKWRDTDGKVYYKHIPGHTTGQLQRMWRWELRHKPFACKFAPNCTKRFNSKVKRHKHHLSHRSKNPWDYLNKYKCDRCGEEFYNLEDHLNDKVNPCREKQTIWQPRRPKLEKATKTAPTGSAVWRQYKRDVKRKDRKKQHGEDYGGDKPILYK
ncbi:hypothetical protein AAMO2058_000862300 [Amorphochlora amoebiformis]